MTRLRKSASTTTRGQETPARNWRVWARRGLIAGIIAVVLGTVLGGAAFAYAWSTMELPDETPLAQTTFINDAQGNRLASISAGENRVQVPLEETPQLLRDAVLATEDRKFYEHNGVDPRGVLRALWNDVRSGSAAQGGSTLTQQYVKTQYVGQERTLTRKVREAILAIKLEQKLTKDEIFGRYLNAIYFGRGAYGVQAASKAYFGKDVKDVGVQEAAYLSGLIRAPELADAYSSANEATSRRNLSLESMVAFGRLAQEDADAVKAVPLQTYVIPRAAQEPTVVNAEKGTNYFVDFVRRDLVRRYGEEAVVSGGLRVTTTLDTQLQAQAYDSIYGFLKPGEPAGALVSVNDLGEIKAMVGGRDYKQSQVNLAVGREGGGTGRPAGSTFKPFALAAAIEGGMSVRQTFPAPSKMTLKQKNGQSWPVSNFDDESFGRVNLIEATVHSVNTVYGQLVVEEGADSLVKMAKAAGIRSELQPNEALVLGTDDVSPLDMAAAYMTFGRGGQYVEPTALIEVRNSDGDLLDAVRPKKSQAMSQKTADTVNHVLQQVVQRGTGTAAKIGQPLAGKTGTTEGNGDAWFVGYTPKLSTAVWMGYPEGSSRKMTNVRGRQVTGGSFPAQMFGNYMRTATAGVENNGFAEPSDFGTPPESDLPPPTTSSTTTTTAAVPTTESPTTTGDLRPLPERPRGEVRPGGASTTTTTQDRRGRGGDEGQSARERLSGVIITPSQQ